MANTGNAGFERLAELGDADAFDAKTHGVS